jgi:hypothetical protein
LIINTGQQGRTYISTIKNLSRLYVKYDQSAGLPDEVFSGGLVVLNGGTNGSGPVQFYVIPQLEVTLTDDPDQSFPDLSNSYLIGEATSLGNSGNGETRWQETDPTTIESVINGEMPGGLPSTNSNIPYIWDFNTGKKGVQRLYGKNGPVYDNCRITLSIQAR